MPRARMTTKRHLLIAVALMSLCCLAIFVVPWWSGAVEDLPHVLRTSATEHITAKLHEATDQDRGGWALEAEPLPPQCAPLGGAFQAAVRRWLRPRRDDKRPRLIYNCEPHRRDRLCGGMGDRFRGMVTVAYLALVLDRRFFLYHPAPQWLQDYLMPTKWLDWTIDPNATDWARIPVDTRLMRLKQHKAFILAASEAFESGGGSDLRVQSNSFGVDPYLHRVPSLSRRVTEGLGLSKQCNLTCYFSCFYSLLFRPSPVLQQSVASVFAPLREDVKLVFSDVDGTFDVLRGDGVPSAFVGVQIRMGGDWASGLAVREPFRTPPAAIPHFVSLLKELTMSSRRFMHLRGAAIFVTSDAERLVNMTRETFAPMGIAVLSVPGGYGHTDSSELHRINPSRWRPLDAATRRANYLATLTSHYIVANSNHVVMAQSGFGDTAFWRSRREASCIFVDMTSLKGAWQHHLSYNCGRFERCSTTEACGCPATASMNRLIDVTRAPVPYYGGS